MHMHMRVWRARADAGPTLCDQRRSREGGLDWNLHAQLVERGGKRLELCGAARLGELLKCGWWGLG